VTDLAYLPGLSTPRKSRTIQPALAGWILPLALTAVWEVVSRAGLVASNHLPAPSAVAVTLLRLAESGDLQIHLAATLERVGFGFLLGAAAGTVGRAGQIAYKQFAQNNKSNKSAQVTGNSKD